MKWLGLSVFLTTFYFSPQGALGSVELGIGISSVTSARFVPGISLALSSTDRDWVGTAVGIQTSNYYESYYTLAYNWSWNAGPFFWGNVRAGFGPGIGYIERGYTSIASSNVQKETQGLIGPNMRVSWQILDPLALTFDALFGLEVASLSLATHDLVLFSLGLHF